MSCSSVEVFRKGNGAKNPSQSGSYMPKPVKAVAIPKKSGDPTEMLEKRLGIRVRHQGLV